MSSIGSIMNSALSAMNTSQTGISMSANNIANAGNLNYSRQRLTTSPIANLLGNGPGLGVEIASVEALRDRLIDQRLVQEDARRSGANELSQALGGIEVLFNDAGGQGLQHHITSFLTSFQNLSSDPTSMAFREVVSSNGSSMAAAFTRLRNDLASMQNQSNKEVPILVAKINSLTSRIAEVTAQISQTEVLGQANELRDQRAALVRELSAIAEVRELDSGSEYQLMLGAGRTLVLESRSLPLTVQADAQGMARVMMGTDDVTREISAGQLHARLQLRDTYIPGYLTPLDALAYDILQAVNTRHTSGYNLNGGTGVPFFNPLASAAGAASLMSVNSAITSNARNIAASSETNGSGNQVAIQIGNLMFEPVSANGSLLDQYSLLVFKAGSDTESAEIALREHDALANQLEMRRQAMSGVSIDEETVQMLQFQRAFQASARLISAVDEMLQVVLAIGR
jgi:flagellar hook-associated protein 1 FlgK